MSEDNGIIIRKYDDKYRVEEMNMSSGFISTLEIYATLEEATKEAERYCSENEVEYGIRFKI